MSRSQPYSPSWVDRLSAWVEKMPGGSWPYYLGLGLSVLLIQSVVSWIEGAVPVGNFIPQQAYMAGVLSFLIALIYYLDKWALSAFAEMRPALKTSEEEYKDFQYRLTTLPAGLTLLAGLATPAAIFLLETLREPYRLESLDSYPISANLLYIVYMSLWLVFGTFLYHTIHQLRIINNIYTNHSRVNLFQMRPLYGFSNLTALTAGSIAFVAIGWQFVNPFIELNDPAAIVLYLIVLTLATVVFIWPQIGIHRLQIDEKERLLKETNQRYERMIGKFHQRIDTGELEDTASIITIITSLQTESSSIERVPTWPWNPDTLRLLVSALALPMGLWLLQTIIQRIFAP